MLSTKPIISQKLKKSKKKHINLKKSVSEHYASFRWKFSFSGDYKNVERYGLEMSNVSEHCTSFGTKKNIWPFEYRGSGLYCLQLVKWENTKRYLGATSLGALTLSGGGIIYRARIFCRKAVRRRIVGREKKC